MSRAALAAALAGAIALFVALAAEQAREKSATYDEPYYIAAGISYLERGDTEAARRLGLLALPGALEALPLGRGGAGGA